MARDKFTRGRRDTHPIRLQDASGLDDRIATTVVATVVQPIATRVELLERALAALQVGVVHTADLEMPIGRRSGIVFVEPPEGYVVEAIGAPVLINQRAGGDDELCIAAFTAEVISTRKMRVAFSSVSGVPKQLSIVYLIG